MTLTLCVRRLRADGYTVVERARPRVQSATLDMNHGRVLAAAAPGVRMSAVELGLQPTTFEAVCTLHTRIRVVNTLRCPADLQTRFSCCYSVVLHGVFRRTEQFVYFVRRFRRCW